MVQSEREVVATSILVVEDNADLRQTIRDILEYGGYRVMTARSGFDALHVLLDTRSTPDLIVSDIVMDEMDGYQLREVLRNNEHWSHIPFIFLSAYPEAHKRCSDRTPEADCYVD